MRGEGLANKSMAMAKGISAAIARQGTVTGVDITLLNPNNSASNRRFDNKVRIKNGLLPISVEAYETELLIHTQLNPDYISIKADLQYQTPHKNN